MTKWINIQLLLFFVLTIFSFLVFLGEPSFPDHFFRISSNSNSINIVSYAFASLIIAINYITGVWVVLPFFAFCLTYNIIIKRQLKRDLLYPLNLYLLLLFVSYYLCPKFLGGGIYHFLTQISPIWIILTSIFSATYTALAFLYKKDINTLPILFSNEKETIKPKIKTAQITEYPKALLDFEEEVINNIVPDEEYFENISKKIEDKLQEFKIDIAVTEILKGPIVDTFLIELGKGVKVSRIFSIVSDLSMALYGEPIRIVYPIKGKTALGIEVPRSPREMIYLNELLKSKEFQANLDPLPMCMGKDAYGNPFITDLASMPHMLVAGSTGSGKSVFINAILVSLLAKKDPSEMKLILIDPKQLELALYAKLPHLIMPVIIDAKMASKALMWATQEMERRYAILKELGVRNLESFNEKIKDATPNQIGQIVEYYDDSKDGYELPYIVIIVDEFADLILTKAGKMIENNICRLAGKARACGIHLIIATQRPSVDVITGLIKSNFPTRVSFKVTTSVDSRTILSAMGAEKLLGKGDMLLKKGVETYRVHSAYVDEDSIYKFIQNIAVLKQQFDPFILDFLEKGDSTDPYSFGSHISTSFKEDNYDDPLIEDAIKIITELKVASASMLQRRLKVGYNRAANIIEELEKKGIVGPSQGARPRQVLL